MALLVPLEDSSPPQVPRRWTLNPQSSLKQALTFDRIRIVSLRIYRSWYLPAVDAESPKYVGIGIVRRDMLCFRIAPVEANWDFAEQIFSLVLLESTLTTILSQFLVCSDV